MDQELKIYIRKLIIFFIVGILIGIAVIYGYNALTSTAIYEPLQGVPIQ